MASYTVYLDANWDPTTKDKAVMVKVQDANGKVSFYYVDDASGKPYDWSKELADDAKPEDKPKGE